VTIRYERQGLRVVRVVDATAPLLGPPEPAVRALALEQAAAFLHAVAAGLRAERERTLALRYKHQLDRAREAVRLGRPLPNSGPGRDVTGAQLLAARQAVGLSQRGLAAEWPYGRSLVAEVERGVRSCPPDLGEWVRGVLSEQAPA
jgi:hypothetical protein